MPENAKKITDAPKRKLTLNTPIVRNVALVATGAVAAVAVIAVLKKAPALEVIATVEDVKA